jgi:hypothetical protein
VPRTSTYRTPCILLLLGIAFKNILRYSPAMERERTYAELTYGFDEPEFAWLTGKTLRLLTREMGDEATHDNNGDPINDDELYLLDKDGIVPVRD